MRYFRNPFSDDYSDDPSAVDVPLTKDRIWHYLKDIESRLRPTANNCDGGLYVGCAGVAYMFLSLSKKQSLGARYQSRLMQLAKKYTDVSLQYANSHQRRADDVVGFLLGNSGVFAVGCAFYGLETDVGQSCLQKFVGGAEYCAKPGDIFGFGSDEVLVGRAGYVAGVLWLRKQLSVPVLDDKTLHKICTVMVDCGSEYAARHRSKSPLMYSYYDTEYLGAAHGLAGIIQVLLQVPGFVTSHPEAAEKIRGAVDFMLSLEQENGNYPPAMDDVGRDRGSHELVHWCHGAPGVVYMLVAAHVTWPDDERYLAAAVRCGQLTWRAGLLKKGPGICHGVAGSGYVFLTLYRVTKDPTWLHRAARFADFLFSEDFRRAATPDCPHSLFEGTAGTICFLQDLMDPDDAKFPLMPLEI